MVADVNLFMDILVNKNEMLEQMKTTQKTAFEAGRTFAAMGTSASDAFKQGQASLNQFDARMLSVLFSGMALQRAFGGLNRAMFNTFMQAEDNSSALFVATNKLGAAWEFLKFSIVDALDNTVFLFFIDGITSVINFISQMPDAVKIAVLSITATLALLGTGAVIYSQIKLAWDAIFGVGGILAVRALETASAVKQIETSVVAAETATASATFGGLVAALGVVTVTAFTLIDAFKQINDMTAKFTETEAPAAADSYLANADNVEILNNGLNDLNVEWSNLREGVDRTIPLQTTFNATTGEFNQHIVTQQDELKGVNAVLQDYIAELNSIPREVTTTIRTVREGSGDFTSTSSVSD